MILVRRVTISFVRAQFSHFRIPYNTLCLPPKFLHKPLFSNDPGSTAFLKTIIEICNIWGAKGVYYGGFENSQYPFHT